MVSSRSRHGAMILRGTLLALVSSSAFACVASSPDQNEEAEGSAALAKSEEDILGQNNAAIDEYAMAKPTDIAESFLAGQAIAPASASIVYVPCGGNASALDAKAPSADPSVIQVCSDPCTPGSVRSCYGGPDGTVDVGVCHAGTQVCYADGGGYGPCKGQTVPSAEVCGTPEDEDCNGAGNCPNVGGLEWVASYSAQFSSPVVPWGLAVDNAGNAYAAGTFDYNGNFAGQTLPNDYMTNGFLQKLNTQGSPVWAKNFSSGNAVRIADVKVDSQGNVIVAGHFYGTLTHDSGTIASVTGADEDVFVAKYSSDGTPIWIRTIGGAGHDELTQMTVDTNGAVIFHVRPGGAISFGSYTHVPVSHIGMIAKLDSGGNPVWARSGLWVVNDMDTDGTNILLTGSFGGTIDLGTGPMTATGIENAFVAKLNGNGITQWAKTAGSTGQDYATSVAADGAGNVYVGGTFSAGPMDWGVTPMVPAGPWHDAFIVKLNANGVAQWNRGFGDANNIQSVKSIDADAAGNVTIGVDCSGTCNPGLGIVGSGNGAADTVIATYSPTGQPIYQRSLGVSAVDANRGVAMVNGKIIVATVIPYGGSYDLGTGLLPQGAYVAQLQP